MNDLIPIRNALNGKGVFDGAHMIFLGRKKGWKNQGVGLSPLPARREGSELGLGALGNGMKEKLMSKDTMARLRRLTAPGEGLRKV